MRYVTVIVALAGCIPVSYRTSASAIRDVAPTLRREGRAVVAASVQDDVPSEDSRSEDSPSTSAQEVVRLDEPIRVRLVPQASAWSVHGGPLSEEQTMTVAALIADCPPDLDNTEANRSAYPHCGLFRADELQLRHGHRAETWKWVVAGTVAAAAGDIVCIAECGNRSAEAATVVGVVSLGAVVAAVATGFFVYELAKDDGPRN